jgi:hypothetical protein
MVNKICKENKQGMVKIHKSLFTSVGLSESTATHNGEGKGMKSDME